MRRVSKSVSLDAVVPAIKGLKPDSEGWYSKLPARLAAALGIDNRRVGSLLGQLVKGQVLQVRGKDPRRQWKFVESTETAPKILSGVEVGDLLEVLRLPASRASLDLEIARTTERLQLLQRVKRHLG